MGAAWAARPADGATATAGPPVTSASTKPTSKPTAPVPAELAADALIGAACCVQHSIMKMLPTQLGLQLAPLDVPEPSQQHEQAVQHTHQQGGRSTDAGTVVTALCSDGAVLSLRTGSGPTVAQLLQLQHQQEQQAGRGMVPPGYSAALGPHAQAWQLQIPPATELTLPSMDEGSQPQVLVCNAVDVPYIVAGGAGSAVSAVLRRHA